MYKLLHKLISALLKTFGSCRVGASGHEFRHYLYHWEFEPHYIHQILETECLKQYKPGIAASLRHEFFETVTKTRSTVQNEWYFDSIKGKLLFKHKLVYTRKSERGLERELMLQT
jgi:hypothetical protein